MRFVERPLAVALAISLGCGVAWAAGDTIVKVESNGNLEIRSQGTLNVGMGGGRADGASLDTILSRIQKLEEENAVLRSDVAMLQRNFAAVADSVSLPQPPAPPSSPKQDFSEDLVFYLNFDEGDAASHGSVTSGTVAGSPGFETYASESKVRGSGYLSLSKTSDFIDMGTSMGSSFSELTLAAWVRTSSADGYHLAIIHRQSAWSLQTKATNLAYYCWCSPLSAQSSTSINDGEWHHVALTLSGTSGAKLIFYVDGEVADGGTHTIGMGAGGGNVYVGKGANTMEHWIGDIDEAAMWTKVLSPSQIFSMYSHGIGTGR